MSDNQKTWKEERLLGVYSESLGLSVSVMLITWADGTKSVHWKNGDHDRLALKRANYILEQRQLKIKDETEYVVGSSGIYYELTER